MGVRSLIQEDPPEGGMATHSSIVAWRITWTEEPGGLQTIGSQSQRLLSDQHTHTYTHIPVDPPEPGMELGSPALQADSLPAELPGKPPPATHTHILN